MSSDHSSFHDPANEHEPDSTGTDRYRLPDSAVPTNYRLRIVPDVDQEKFRGSVAITVTVLRPSEVLVLNSDALDITSAKVDGKPVTFSLDAELERLTLHHQTTPGELVVELDFSGKFDPQLVGFYLSAFTDSEGTDRVLASTQFESTYARKAFPCWDEPAFKATFDLTIVAPPKMNAIANTSEIAREEDEGGTQITFATTMVMSTYLVAFVVGPIEITEPVDIDGTPLRIVHVTGAGSTTVARRKELLTGDEAGSAANASTVAPSSPSQASETEPAAVDLTTVDLTAFAAECGAFGLRYFSEYFGIPYPGDKVDLVAIPDFAMGAMENLGCITFRESLLLVDPEASTQSELQRIADVIFHELAHMWFGDLVTMKWWNGLWLNEAFATFMEMRCTDAFRPKWQRWVDFGLSRTAAFDVDALASTRPIEFDVVSPDDAEAMFDVLTYEKGAAVVRMLEQHLGEGPFRSGIRRYMTENAYGNTETTDLWDAIEAQTNEPVRAIMDSWIFQGGAPVIHTELAANGRSVTFSQERLHYLGGDEVSDQNWMVPIRYRWKPVGGDPITGHLLLDSDEAEVELAAEAGTGNGPGGAEWLVANADGASYLRVIYPPEALDMLGSLAFEALAPVERYAMVDDAWAAVLSGLMSAASFLSLLESLTAEGDRSVWQRILAGFSSISRLLDGEAKVVFEAIAHDAFAPALAGLTLSPQDDDDDRSRQLRGDLIRAMGTTANDEEIQREAQRTVSEGRRSSDSVETSIMAAAIDVVASIGDQTDLDDFLAAADAAATPQEYLRYLYATADFPDFEQLEIVLNMILNGEVRSQNASLWINRALRNRTNGPRVWELVQQNWETLTSIVPTSTVARMVTGVSTLTAQGAVDQATAFFAAHPVPQGEQNILQILERQRVGTALRAREAVLLNAILAPR